MSRQSTVAQRNLTLTEELEKLEQSITLTLQEIDHNFSRAHRIVTTSILPIVDQYAEHSKNVWEGAKFWKQFFEASANVSLSGYEEVPPEDETVNEEDTTAGTTPSTSTYGSPPTAHDPSLTPQQNGHPYADDGLSPSPSYSTPRPTSKSSRTPTQKRAHRQPQTAPYSSPYESLKRTHLPSAEPSPSTSDLPSTPRANTVPYDDEADPQSSPFAPPSAALGSRTPATNDILLHRVLDKNYRIQATPHSAAKLPLRSAVKATPRVGVAGRRAQPDTDDLDSSPMTAAPELHAEIFGSPEQGRKPGVSVLTPAKELQRQGGERSAIKGVERGAKAQGRNAWDSDDSDGEGEGLAGMSPPKTIQFHVPPGRLMRTPAREASKRIVEDLLLTAGGNVSEDLEEDSPSVIKRGGLLEEDTF